MSISDRWTDGRTDNVKTVYSSQAQFAGSIKVVPSITFELLKVF